MISLPFVASEDAETLDEVIRGTEEQLERTYTFSSNHTPLSNLNVVFVAYVKRWLHDGKGLMASKSVSVIHRFPIVFFDISSQTVVVMPGLK